MPSFLHQGGKHNKLWKYEVNGLTVNIEYGRVGQTLRPDTKTFATAAERDRFIAKKIAEKKRKGYHEANAKKVKQETRTAQQLGTQYKISRMVFVSKKGNRLSRIANYDPKKFVYVEILNSWKKDITRLLLSKTESFRIAGGVTESGRTITFGNKTSIGNTAFVAAVRGVLRKMSEQLVEVVKTVKFAATGARKLFDDEDGAEDFEPAQDFSAILKQVDCAGFDESVVTKFASAGARVLDL